ncbi:hypothetical protein AVEN_18818-1 [Araneus ventricosus]|uniref:Uncharacterized protein n=1 Tax=Araneus ventricosus TaxID=182803 RepID=A0A4Y2U9Z0_ARAVE|nr:hypothetical protein AVEN_18818-1 [Araneus ventricosus]
MSSTKKLEANVCDTWCKRCFKQTYALNISSIKTSFHDGMVLEGLQEESSSPRVDDKSCKNPLLFVCSKKSSINVFNTKIGDKCLQHLVNFLKQIKYIYSIKLLPRWDGSGRSSRRELSSSVETSVQEPTTICLQQKVFDRCLQHKNWRQMSATLGVNSALSKPKHLIFLP